jgi:hypothetical protein
MFGAGAARAALRAAQSPRGEEAACSGQTTGSYNPNSKIRIPQSKIIVTLGL